MRLYNDNEDCAWLLDTHLKSFTVPVFRSFVLHGNEDCPQTIELFESFNPLLGENPVARFDLLNDLTYQRTI